MGKVSRCRRAKSASKRSLSSAKSKYSDRRELFLESDSSSSDTVVMAGEQDKSENLDYAAQRIRQIKNELKNERNVCVEERVRPINIDMAMGNEQMYLSGTFSVKGIVFIFVLVRLLYQKR